MPTDLPPGFKGTQPEETEYSDEGLANQPLPARIAVATILLSIAAVTAACAIWLCVTIVGAAGLGG